MNEAISAGDLVWIPSAVKLHSQYAKSLITKTPRNFLVTSVESNHLNVLIDGEEWTVSKGDTYPAPQQGTDV
tara:strand:+ start:105 stop:320 length:216 start_codon:yes stop_codon:yes gene_type:complete